MHPEDSVYYNGAFVLQALQKNTSRDLLDLYLETSQVKKMSMPVFMLCLDWLYLLNILTLDARGRVTPCT
ncbi:MAG: hypothetical protein GY757_29650 [bacterium]|nr:hypothetical protein [bacterium]